MATYSSIPAWKIKWTKEPGRLQSLGSQELDMTERLNLPTYCVFKWTSQVARW